ncbi:hypothetical protein Q5P01_000369 [Channa striata]|uniref:Uncharacterized protein n=1 Tax=Channa striata TaxID=64152 RepID=A0AA88IH77_CHASR|nr:hypothetical protein Q5P01_000369 [Channa striata]
MVLSDGSLFFLSVAGSRRSQAHEGVYTCVARNSAGRATSRNASLYIAVLQEEFGGQPSDVEVAEGEVAVLNCGAPVGHPEPNIIWKKDGAGSAVCDHRGRCCSEPLLVLKPENVSVRMGESAQFYCQAEGDPPPAVVWGREQGPLPNGRYLVNPDQTLQIHYVTAQDSGKYTCTAANDVGVVTISAQLLVEEAASTEQKDLHKELSALRVALENVTIMAPGSNISQVQWKPHYLDGFEVLYRLPSAAPLAVSITVSHEQNNTVHLSWDGQHNLDISTLTAGNPYRITIAAVNGAGVGTLSDPHGFVINPQISSSLDSDRWELSEVLALFRDPVLIGSIGALLWCILMIAAYKIYVCVIGLHRLANEDLVIKHRMAAPDSPWVSGSWRPAFNQKYQDLWAQGLPVSSKKDSSCLDSAVPIVTDSCGVYGTFYVDLMGNSPGRQPKMPHDLPHQQGAETIQIFTQPVAKASPLGGCEVLPWKQASQKWAC